VILRRAALLLALVSSAASAQESIRVVHVGDINLARTVARRYILGGRGAEVFAGTQDYLRTADIAIGNLESVLIDRGAATDSAGSVVFAGPSEGARLLRDAGLDIIVTANNHAWDLGLSGLLESRTHLSAAGLQHTGTGPTLDDAWRPAIVRAKGITVAVFSLATIFNNEGLGIEGHPAECCVAWGDTLRLRAAAQAARDSLGAHVVLVSIHHGTEYVGVPRRAEREFARALARTGVDAVIGHHPHVPQGVERVGGVPVIHSLGNFVFLQNRPWTRVGFIAELEIGTDRSVMVTMRPVAATFTPTFLRGADSVAAMRHLDSLSAALPPQ
jgi:poly-gamma-glutamate capsule biosynthesis protein CapA/YwtB (metallophosphatase superfamily)